MIIPFGDSADETPDRPGVVVAAACQTAIRWKMFPTPTKSVGFRASGPAPSSAATDASMRPIRRGGGSFLNSAQLSRSLRRGAPHDSGTASERAIVDERVGVADVPSVRRPGPTRWHRTPDAAPGDRRSWEIGVARCDQG